LSIKEQNIEPLGLNVVLVLRYNLEFMRERQLQADEGSRLVAQTFQQHLTLFSDKLSSEALEFIQFELNQESGCKVA
jgi:hypothetical protein